MSTYLTVPEELLGRANVVKRYLEDHGYRLSVEPSDVSYPYAPTWRAKRQHTTVIVELQPRIDLDRVMTWVQYAKTCARDTQVVVAIPDSFLLKSTIEHELISMGVGILVCSDDVAYEKLVAKDQAVSVQLPPLRTLPHKVKRLLAPSYEKIERGDWREGFRSACQVVEVEARNHLKESVSRSRIRLVSPQGKVVTTTPEKIEKLTAGHLADMYGMIDSPNHAEAIVEQALRQLNKDRIGIIHHEKKAKTEASLRRNVGRHMFVIINALKALIV